MHPRRALALLLVLACNPGQFGESAGEACELAPDPGDCDYAETRWYYDPEGRRCAAFTYSGCEGVVPFELASQCQSACESCDQLFADTKPVAAGAPTFTVRNTGGAIVYLQAYAADEGPLGFRRETFGITRSGGGERLITAPNVCDFPCAAFKNAECSAACSDDGPPPPPIAIAPGGQYTGAWDGLHFGDFDMPARCVPDACSGALTCGRWQVAADADYEVHVTWADALRCALPDCTCTPNADGWCALTTAAELVGPQDAAGSFFYPGTEPVQIDL